MRKILGAASAILLATSSYGQAFVNLDFEDAYVQINDPTYGFLDWNLAVPGWSHSAGDDTGIVYYGSPHLGLSQVYLLKSAVSPYYAPNTQLAGEFSLAFASGYANAVSAPAPGDPWINAYISQTGNIPAGSLSLQMLATGPFQVLLNGGPINMQSLGGNLYGGDITGFGGTIAELKIMNTAPFGFAHDDTVVDNISFSPVAVPEPGASQLVLGGIIALAMVKRKFSGSHRD